MPSLSELADETMTGVGQMLMVPGFPPPLDPSLVGAFWLLLAILLLDLFDISLPRGDSVGVAGALAGAAVVVVGPVRAAIIIVASAVVAHVIRRGSDSPSRLLAILVSRGSALVLATLTLAAIANAGGRLLAFTLVPAVFLVAEMATAQVYVAVAKRRPLSRLLRGNFRTQAPALAAQWSASVLLLLTYGKMSSWSLIPVVALLLLMRQSYALFLDIRETYRTTVEVLVEAAESQDERRFGHAERTAATARAIAMHIGLPAPAVERISYAALLHDLGELSAVADAEGFVPLRDISSAEVVAGVEFFKGVEPILRICDGDAATVDVSADLALAAMIVALASDIDCETSVNARASHRDSTMGHVVPWISSTLKARVVGAAIELGYPIPAVS
jgi:hypothetical protein